MLPKNVEFIHALLLYYAHFLDQMEFQNEGCSTEWVRQAKY